METIMYMLFLFFILLNKTCLCSSYIDGFESICFSDAQREGLDAVPEFIMSSLELQHNKITDDEVKNKSSIALRFSEPYS